MSFLSKPLLPKEHGAWVALLIPMFIGAVAYPHDSFHLPAIVLLAICSSFGIFAMEPMRIALKRAENYNKSRVYTWMAIYSAISSGSFGLLVYRYERWGLLWFIIPAILMAALKLGSSIIKMERAVWIEIVGTLGLTLSCPAAFYTQHGSFLVESLILYLLCAIWVVDRAITARAILSRIRSRAVPHNKNGVTSAIGQLSTHIGGLLAGTIVLIIFRDNAPSMAIVPFFLGTYKNVDLMIFGNMPTDPFKFGFSEMRLSALFALLMVVAWRIDLLL